MPPATTGQAPNILYRKANLILQASMVSTIAIIKELQELLITNAKLDPIRKLDKITILKASQVTLMK